MFKKILQKTSIFFYHIKILLQQLNKSYFEKIYHQLFNNQSIELSSSNEIDNIVQEGEVIFEKNLPLGLPEVSKLIDSAISKRQGDQRKQSFLEKKYSIKGKMDSL